MSPRTKPAAAMSRAVHLSTTAIPVMAQSVESELVTGYAGAVPNASLYAMPDIPKADLMQIKVAAYARRLQPLGRWGAWEPMARHGRVSLDDAAVHGGLMYGGPGRWRLTVSYGDVDLNRFGIIGNTQELLSRMQLNF